MRCVLVHEDAYTSHSVGLSSPSSTQRLRAGLQVLATAPSKVLVRVSKSGRADDFSPVHSPEFTGDAVSAGVRGCVHWSLGVEFFLLHSTQLPDTG